MKKMLVAMLLMLLAFGTKQANAVTIDFETLPDLTSVGDFYASNGVHFQNSISLTAGFSLNEIDFPPSSGVRAIGDDNAPIGVHFDNPASGIAANFTYDTLLTFTAFDASNHLIGTFVNNQSSNLGSSQIIPLSFSDVSSLVIAGQINNEFIMDDFTFTEAQPTATPEPSTIMLLGVGLFGIMGLRKFHRRESNA